MGFRPEDYRPDPEADQREEEERAAERERRGPGHVPAGTYVYAPVRVSHRTFGNGGKKLNFKLRVLDAEPNLRKHIGHEFWSGCGIESAGQLKMLGRVCFSMGLTNEDEFDPQDIQQVRRAMLFRPMVSQVTYEQKGKYHNNDWGRFVAHSDLQPSTIDKFAEYRRALIDEFGEPGEQERSNEGGGGYGGDPGPSDEDAPPGRFF